MHKIVVGQININSIRNKSDPLRGAVAGTQPIEMTVILTVVAFWFVLAMTLGHV